MDGSGNSGNIGAAGRPREPREGAAWLRSFALAGVGWVFGAALDLGSFGLGGLALGLVAGWCLSQRGDMRRLDAGIRTLRARVDVLEAGRAREGAADERSDRTPLEPERPEPTAAPPRPDRPEPAAAPPAGHAEPPLAPPAEARAAERPQPAGSPAPRGRPAPSRGPRPAPRTARPAAVDAAVAAMQSLFVGRNTVVNVGVLVLLVGVTLLGKWAADNALFPIEARLGLGAAIGLALAATGFRMRGSRPEFASALEGAGVAALYLIALFAYRTFALLPAPLAFAIFVALTFALGALAFAQRSQPLMVIGSIGGLAAPLAASSGSGNHVALFAFYLVLNLGIAAVARLRGWRPVQLVAFFGTYGVATAFGVLSYTPEKFATTEPFLLAFFMLFSLQGISLSQARAEGGRGAIDGTLVFGTPLVTLLLQSRLVAPVPFGMAYSAAGFGLYYAAVVFAIGRSRVSFPRPLVEAMVAIAIGFATMAIPFAFDDALTTAIAWSLEGAGIYWVGIQQSRRLPRLSGVGLQGLAALAFAVAFRAVASGGTGVADPEWWIANGRFLSCAAMAGSGLFIARMAWSARDRLVSGRPKGWGEWQVTQAFAVWGLGWALVGVLGEVERFVAAPYRLAVALGAIAAISVGLEAGGRAADFSPGRALALFAIPAGGVFLAIALVTQPHLGAHGGVIAWPVALAGLYIVLDRLEDTQRGWARAAYAPTLWLVGAVAGFAVSRAAGPVLALDGDWSLAGFGMGVAATLLVTHELVRRQIGPAGRLRELHVVYGAGVLAFVAAAYVLAIQLGATGSVAPLVYVPGLSPIGVATASVALALYLWSRDAGELRPQVVTPARAYGVLGAIGFAWLNGAIARSVSQWADVPFRADRLFAAAPFQVALSISWTLVALAGMVAASLWHKRSLWIVSASLLCAVVVKLFAIDLSQQSPLARIGTFLVVGLLLLVVGYFSPVPPASRPGSSERPRDSLGEARP